MRTCIAATIGIALASCSTLENIHDPQVGPLSGEEISSLLKSVRCELITFYSANAARKEALDRIRDRFRGQRNPTIPLKVVLDHKYFDLDTDAYGAFVLEAKVVDTVGLPGTSTSLANVLHTTAGHSQTLTVAPNLSSQGTYDMNYNFAIQQDNDLSDAHKITEDELAAYNEDVSELDDPLRCYHALVVGRYDELAEGRYPRLERFHRITVDGGLPLAAWLRANTTTMGVSRNILADANPPKAKNRPPRTHVPVDARYLSESIDGGQMSYIFTVLYTAGIDAKFSLLSSRWNLLATDFSAGRMQTGVLSVYVNGFMTVAALGAKSGAVVIAGKDSQPAPQQVFVINGYSTTPAAPTYPPPKSYPPVLTKPVLPEEHIEGGKVAPEAGRMAAPKAPAAPSGPNRGQFLVPITPFLLAPGP